MRSFINCTICNYYYDDQINKKEIEEACSAHKVLLRKPKAKKPLGRHRRRQEDNTEMGIKGK
jgi:hypothetical protein